MKVAIRFLLICFFAGSLPLIAQNQYNVWYFGFDSSTVVPQPTADIDFNGGAPVALLNSQMKFTEGCATYCNSAGQLLFYTNGDSVWDRTHTPMPNGGVNFPGQFNQSSMQNSVFVPTYGDTNNYYLFLNAGIPTAGNVGIVYYTKIDMTLNGGDGDVNAPFTQLITGSSERIVGVKHCNGKDHWIVTHISGTNTFYSFRATKCGVMDTVISIVGPVEGGGSSFASLKASPKGNKLSTVIHDAAGDVITSIYNFDNATGRITGYTAIDSVTSASGVISIANMFSPDGNLFYLASGANIPMDVFQFDLNATNIPGSKTLVGAATGSFPFQIALAYDFQIGRDGKLYLSNSDIQMSIHSLDAVNNPNVLGTGCGFVQNAVSLGNRSSWLNLPNHISDYLTPLPIQPFIAGFTYSNACSNSPVSFTDTSQACSVKWWKWNFGDSSSGAANTSSLENPSHSYSSSGTYSVTLIISDGCELDTVTNAINIVPSTAISVSSNTSICPGNNAALSASGASTYLWSPSTGLSSTTGASVTANPTSTMTYTVTGFNGGCFDTARVTVNVGSLVFSISGVTSICPGNSTTLTASGATSYVWQPSASLNSSTGQIVTSTPTGTTTYSVTGTDASGCTGEELITVTVNNNPSANAGVDISVCQGSSATLNASGGASFLWSTGASTSSINVSSANAVYTVTVSNGPCQDIDTVVVNTLPLPPANAGSNVSICPGTSTSLTATGGSSFLWSTGSSNSSVSVSPPITAVYTVTVSNGSCQATDAVTVTVLPVPTAGAGADVTIVQGNSATLSGSGGGGGSYMWSPTTGLSCITCQNPLASPQITTMYSVLVTDGNGCTSLDSVLVIVDVTCGENLLIPNVFTPNSDNVNDLFTLTGFDPCFEEYTISIFNRWGILMFSTNKPGTVFWDGKTSSGQNVTDGVYYYVLVAKDQTLKGHLTLIR